MICSLCGTKIEVESDLGRRCADIEACLQRAYKEPTQTAGNRVTAKLLAEIYVHQNPSEFPKGVSNWADLESTFGNWLASPRPAFSNWCGKVTKAFFTAHNARMPKRYAELDQMVKALSAAMVQS